jgi:hypothetical protein
MCPGISAHLQSHIHDEARNHGDNQKPILPNNQETNNMIQDFFNDFLDDSIKTIPIQIVNKAIKA